ncbi:MAG: hypothetical protein LBO65_05300 [Spirochaetaceae bacterium]|jgi:hypothetical protein|nr:hypothetical protein [Spirochaetaceae bacterium]
MGKIIKIITGVLGGIAFVLATLAMAAYALGCLNYGSVLEGERDSFGDEYSGRMVSDQFEGPVDIRFLGGDAYAGGFVKTFEGRGIFTSKEGWRCEALFKNGKVQGPALFTGPWGSYRGDLDTFALTGRGKFSSAAGWSYDGDWINGIPQGRGTFTWPDGAVYTGDFKDGLADGRGTLINNSAWTYEGEFSGGIRNGLGVLQTGDGKIIEGRWEMGVLIQVIPLRS